MSMEADRMQNCSITGLLPMRIAITVTSRGVITLPARLRRQLGLKADDVLIAETTSEGLLLRPAVTLPIEIYDEERVREFDKAEAELAQSASHKQADEPNPKRRARKSPR